MVTPVIAFLSCQCDVALSLKNNLCSEQLLLVIDEPFAVLKVMRRRPAWKGMPIGNTEFIARQPALLRAVEHARPLKSDSLLRICRNDNVGEQAFANAKCSDTAQLLDHPTPSLLLR